MRKIYIDPQEIDYSLVSDVAKVIERGDFAVIPTETVYGIAGRADKAESVEKLYDLKKRPRKKPFSFVVDNADKVINYYFSTLPPFGYRVIEEFWPGPITLIYYTHDDKKVGVRVPSHKVAREILKKVNCPVYLPSANLSGQKEASTADEAQEELKEGIDVFIDSGPCEYSQPSTVVDLTCNPFDVLRKGVILETELIDVFARKRLIFVCTGNTCRSPMAEFLLKKYIVEKRPYLMNKYDVMSAGTSAIDGGRAASSVYEVLKDKEQMEIKGFLSTKLDRKLILSSDLIFTMEEAHTRQILNVEPTALGRVFEIKKFLPQKMYRDVIDPIGRGTNVYEEVYNVLSTAITEIMDWL